MKNKTKNPLVIIIAIFVAIAIILGITLGIISLVKSRRAVVSYGSLSIDEGEAKFFISRYKVQFIKDMRALGIDAEDSPEFFATAAEDGVTYGEKFNTGALGYLKEVVVAAYLFDRYASFGKDEKDTVKLGVAEALDYLCGGDKDKFAAECEKYGFNAGDFADAAELLYKSAMAFNAIYGSDGSSVAGAADVCESYLDEYSHVKLLFIRTEEKLEYGDDGHPIFTELTDEERAERLALVESVSAAIEAIKTGGDGQMNANAFNNLIQTKGDGAEEYDTLGYYFHKDAASSGEFADAFPTVVEAALNMEIGEYRKVETHEDDEIAHKGFEGYCFLYRCETTANAYANEELSAWFSDFYMDAALKSFTATLSELSADVKVGRTFDSLTPTAIPMNTSFYPKFS